MKKVAYKLSICTGDKVIYQNDGLDEGKKADALKFMQETFRDIKELSYVQLSNDNKIVLIPPAVFVNSVVKIEKSTKAT